MLAREFPQVRFIQSMQNIGFGKANNLGVQAACGDYLLFLNPDTEVVGPAVQTMVHGMRNLARAGCIGCHLLNSDLSLQTSCIQAFPTILGRLLDTDWFRNRFPKAAIWGMAPLFETTESPARVQAISGACIMVKRDVFDAIGGFSAEFFMYSEDTDLCYKAFKMGFANYYLPTASVIHHGDASVGKARSSFAMVMAVNSVMKYFCKHQGRPYAWTYRTAITVAAFCRLILLLPSHVFHSPRHDAGQSHDSWTKWKSVLRWGVGLESWVDRFPEKNPVPPPETSDQTPKKTSNLPPNLAQTLPDRQAGHVSGHRTGGE